MIRHHHEITGSLPSHKVVQSVAMVSEALATHSRGSGKTGQGDAPYAIWHEHSNTFNCNLILLKASLENSN